ncbi:MAG: NUDIX domain-containing protein [Anaerolineae bacterium]|jgi:mutator protein MutT
MRVPELIVGALLLNQQGEIFVARFSKVAGHYAIPGGHVEYGETVAQALVRELTEETNLAPIRYRLLRVSERIRPPLYKDGTHHLVYLDFLVDRWTGELQLDGDELNDGLWVAPQAALELPLTLTTRQAIEFYLAHDEEGGCRYHPGRVD